MAEDRPIGLGDMVRVRGTPATLAADLAGLTGEVRGATAPSVNRAEVIGKLQEDHAIKVHFEERKEAYWFAPYLLELVQHDVAADTTTDSEKVLKQSRKVGFLSRIGQFLKKKNEDLKQ